MSDLFHKDIPDDYIWNVFEIMALSPQHTFQVLTKRPQRMVDLLAGRYWRDLGTSERPFFAKIIKGEHREGDVPFLPNVWLGVSVENQQAADERIPLLLQTPAAVRFLSCEPLLGPVDLSKWLYNLRIPCSCGYVFDTAIASSCRHGVTVECPSCGVCKCDKIAQWAGEDKQLRDVAGWEWRHPKVSKHPLIDQVIVGGESGHYARPMHPEWARSLQDQCQAAGVAFFFKQWGEWADRTKGDQWEGREIRLLLPDGVDAGGGDSKNGVLESIPGWEGLGGAWMSRVGKKAAGRLLDGHEWSEFPN